MSERGLAAVAGLLADGTRAAVCCSLLDGRAWTASELARATRVAPSTMSEHLSRLVDGGVLVEHRQGRHRYVSLAGAEVASTLEQLLAIAKPTPPRPALNAVHAAAAIRQARTCYDHLAGRLGVALASAMVARGFLDEGLSLTPTGRRWLAEDVGIVLPGSGRPVTRACLDWTERRPHLAGATGALLFSELVERRWVRRIGSSRAVTTTSEGDDALWVLVGLERSSWADDQPTSSDR